MKIERCCSWSLILYENRDVIINTLLSIEGTWSNFALSPLHNLDLNDNGDLKEPHYHLLITFRQWKSLNSIKDLFNFNSNIFGERLYDRWSAFEYLTHLNDTDKVLYDKNDIYCTDLDYYCRSPSKDKDIEKNISLMNMLDLIIKKVPYREMVIQFGKDYVLNYEKYLLMARLINSQEKNKDLTDLTSDLVYFKNTQ